MRKPIGTDLGLFDYFVNTDHSATAVNICKNTYSKGQRVFLQGGYSFGLYKIHSGHIKMVFSNENGNESILYLLGAGDIMGDDLLWDTNSRHSCTATAITECSVIFYKKDFIRSIVSANHGLTLILLEVASKRQLHLEKSVASLSFKNVRERLALLLLSLLFKYGHHGEIDIILTREELGAIVGASHETIVRFMTELKKEGIVTQKGKKIVVIDQLRLEKFAGI